MKKQKRKLNWFGVFHALLVAVIVGSVFSTTLVSAHGTADHISPQLQQFLPGISMALVFGLQFIPAAALPYSMSGIQVELWQNTIQEVIFKNNSFLVRCQNRDQYVLAGKVVHIPQAAAPSNVVKNRTQLPATITKRTDTDITYNLDEYTTDPKLIPNAEEFELSYDKRASVLRDDTMALFDTIADNILITWAPVKATNSASILHTTGSATTAWLSGTTGNRNKFTLADMRAAKKVLDSQNVPMEGRCCLLSPDMYDQLLASLEGSQLAAFQQTYNIETGVVGRLLGFDIYMRSTSLVYDSSDIIKAYGSANATTDCDAALFWNESFVEMGKSGTFAFQRPNDPQFYGDVYSFLVRVGARISRADQKGVVAVIAA